jgi:hypothetical protein
MAMIGRADRPSADARNKVGVRTETDEVEVHRLETFLSRPWQGWRS